MPYVENPVKAAQILDANACYYGFEKLQLMESAGRAIAEKISADFGKKNRIAVFCGLGGNGGDGFVAARYLSNENQVTVFLIGCKEKIKSTEAMKNLLILENAGFKVIEITDSKQIPKKINADLVLECISGTGFKGSLKEPAKTLVSHLNKSKSLKISIDLPCKGFKAEKIYSIAIKKSADAETLGIGIPKEFFYFTGPGNVKFLNKRRPASHKGENGSVLLIAGSEKYHGAAVFAGKASSLFCDLAYFLTEKSAVFHVKKAAPEFIVSEITLKKAMEFAEKADSILIGPGLKESEENSEVLNKLLKKFPEKKFVLDAAALKLIEKKALHKNCILTPHSNEFKSLFKCAANSKNVVLMAKKHSCTILLKGPVDFISNGCVLFRNFSGNALLTAGGTGDVLAGILAAFASKHSLLDSALAASFLTGFAADQIALREQALNASRLIEELPIAVKKCNDFI